MYAGSADYNNELKRPVQDLTPPIIILKAKYIQNAIMDRDLIALIDSGSTGTMIKRSSLPYGARPLQGPIKKTTTTNGILKLSDVATIQQIRCPEFNQIIPDITGDIFDSPTCRYDVILGRRDIAKLGIKLDFTTRCVPDPGVPIFKFFSYGGWRALIARLIHDERTEKKREKK